MKRVIKSSSNSNSSSFQDALEAAMLTYEYGRYFEEDDFDGDTEAYRIYFDELLQLGPQRFYDEYQDELDFSDEFISEYGYVDDEDESDYDDEDDDY